jgi:hypothetical protein
MGEFQGVKKLDTGADFLWKIIKEMASTLQIFGEKM